MRVAVAASLGSTPVPSVSAQSETGGASGAGRGVSADAGAGACADGGADAGAGADAGTDAGRGSLAARPSREENAVSVTSTRGAAFMLRPQRNSRASASGRTRRGDFSASVGFAAGRCAGGVKFVSRRQPPYTITRATPAP